MNKSFLLNLQDNIISSVEDGVFQSLNRLRFLNLQGNSLSSLNRSTFTGLPRLHLLYLRGNKLSEIRTGTFSYLLGIRSLDLSENHLTRIDGDSFNNLTHLISLKLSMTQCSCERIQNLLSSSNHIGQIHLDCHRSSFVNSPLEYIGVHGKIGADTKMVLISDFDHATSILGWISFLLTLQDIIMRLSVWS